MHTLQERLLRKISEIDIWNLTLRGIGQIVGEPSPQKIKHHLFQLEKRGLIKIYRKDNKIKKIERIEAGRLDEKSSLIAIPIFGYADCGPAMSLASQQPEGFVRISSLLLEKRKKLFALQALGDSMNRAQIGKDKNNIEEGDYVLIDPEDQEPKNNDYVLSVIDGCANLKKFVRDESNGRIILASESSQNYPPIFIHPEDDYLINGKIVQVMKKAKI